MESDERLNEEIERVTAKLIGKGNDAGWSLRTAELLIMQGALERCHDTMEGAIARRLLDVVTRLSDEVYPR